MSEERVSLLGAGPGPEQPLYTEPAVVYCVHGNRWGVATCCEELESGATHCHDARQDGGVDKRARNKETFTYSIESGAVKIKQNLTLFSINYKCFNS